MFVTIIQYHSIVSILAHISIAVLNLHHILSDGFCCTHFSYLNKFKENNLLKQMKMFVFCKQWSNVRQWIKCHIFVKIVCVYTWSVSTISFFIWRRAYFRDSKLLFTHLSNFACTFNIMVQHISGNTYHITDIGNVNNITVTYWEYPYNGFDTLRNKNMHSIFQYVTQQPFNIFEEL